MKWDPKYNLLQLLFPPCVAILSLAFIVSPALAHTPVKSPTAQAVINISSPSAQISIATSTIRFNGGATISANFIVDANKSVDIVTPQTLFETFLNTIGVLYGIVFVFCGVVLQILSSQSLPVWYVLKKKWPIYPISFFLIAAQAICLYPVTPFRTHLAFVLFFANLICIWKVTHYIISILEPARILREIISLHLDSFADEREL